MDIEDEYAEDIEDRIELEDIIEEQKKQLSQQNEQLSQQKEQLSQQNNMIVVLIKSMLAEGKNIESISKTLNISIDQITELIS
jgi:polyphosphate kinase 2 (PPK2 family)